MLRVFLLLVFSFRLISCRIWTFPPFFLDSKRSGEETFELANNHIIKNPYAGTGSDSETLRGRDLQYHGTTTLAFKFNESVIVCVDSKASLNTYVGSRSVKKVIPISKTVVATMAGENMQ
jgi:hypothetical protein